MLRGIRNCDKLLAAELMRLIIDSMSIRLEVFRAGRPISRMRLAVLAQRCQYLASQLGATHLDLLPMMEACTSDCMGRLRPDRQSGLW